MQEIQRTWGIFSTISGNLLRIPGNVFILTIAGMPEKIPRNLPEDFGECSRKISGNVTKDFGLLFYFELFSQV